MKFGKEILDQKFKEYYKETNEVATYVFTYSQKQDNLPKWGMCDDGKKNYVNGVLYSQCDIRDSEGDHSNWDDAVLIGVGRTDDIKRK